LHKIIHYTKGPNPLNPKILNSGLSYDFLESHCSTAGGGGIGFGMSIGDGSLIVEQTDTEIMLKVSELEDATDDGNTYMLLSEAEAMNNNNSNEVSQQIASLDGYISDEVAITYMQNNNGNQFVKANTLLENSPLPNAVRGGIDNMEMNPTLKQIVKSQQNGENIREKKQTEIAELKQYRGLVVNEMVNSVLYNDSITIEKQNLKDFLINDKDLQSKFHLLNVYKWEKDFENAEATLSNIKDIVKNSEIENSDELEDYIDLQNVLLKVESGVLTVNEAVEEYSDLIRFISQNESHPGQVAAQLLLAEAEEEEYYELIKLPEPDIIVKSSIIENQVSGTNQIYADIINVYPNPSNGEIFIEYAFLESGTVKSICIYGINGMLIEKVGLTQPAGLYCYNKLLAPGNYIIKVGENFSQQITVQ
jgi:hypothetical protein